MRCSSLWLSSFFDSHVPKTNHNIETLYSDTNSNYSSSKPDSEQFYAQLLRAIGYTTDTSASPTPSTRTSLHPSG